MLKKLFEYGVHCFIIVKLVTDIDLNDQIDVETVRINWQGMVKNDDCADWMRVKYWKSSGSDSDFEISKKLNKTTRTFRVSDLSPYRDYTFQVRTVSSNISRHEKHGHDAGYCH